MLSLESLIHARVPEQPMLTLMRVGIALGALCKAPLAYQILLRLDSPAILKTPYTAFSIRPTGVAVHVFMAVLIFSALALLVGFRPKWSSGILAAAVFAYLFCDQQAFANHALLLGVAALLYSLAAGAAAYAYWPLFLLRYQISLMYFYAGYAKIHADFLAGEVLRMYMHMPFGILQSVLDRLYAPLSWLTILVEIGLAFALWIPRLRWYAAAVGVALHAGIVLTMHPRPQLLAFGIAAIASYPAFFVQPESGTAAPSTGSQP